MLGVKIMVFRKRKKVDKPGKNISFNAWISSELYNEFVDYCNLNEISFGQLLGKMIKAFLKTDIISFHSVHYEKLGNSRQWHKKRGKK